MVYEVDGPRVRLGLLWFSAELVSAIFGVVGIALLFAATAAVASMQTARAWRRAGTRADSPVAGRSAAAVVLAGATTTGIVGVVLIGAALVTVHMARRQSDGDWWGAFARAGATVRCWLLPGFAASCVVVCARFSLGGAIALLVLAGAYETGDYLIGSGAQHSYEGPAAGALTVLVITFAITAVGVRPLMFPTSLVLGAMAALLCPLGQVTASLALPRHDARASALRRLDSLLLLAPAWALVVGILVK